MPLKLAVVNCEKFQRKKTNKCGALKDEAEMEMVKFNRRDGEEKIAEKAAKEIDPGTVVNHQSQ
jgi:hypothetical protein